MAIKLKSDFSLTEIEEKLGTKKIIGLAFVTICINLFFIEALRAFIPSVYVSVSHVVFGEDVLVNGMVLLALLFFFIPGLTNTICKKVGLNKLMKFSIFAIVIFRLLLAFQLPSKLETICVGLIIAFYGFYISTFSTLWLRENDEIQSNHKITFITLTILSAFLIDYFIRALGLSLDISLLTPGLILDWNLTQYFWLIFQIPLSGLCIYLTYKHFPRFSSEIKPEKPVEPEYKTLNSLIFVGVGMFFFLQFSLFLYPNVIAQYTATSYYFNNILNIICLMVATCVILFAKIEFLSDLRFSIISNVFMILSLILFFFFPKDLTYVASIFISISLIIMYLNFYLLFFRMTTINFKWEKVKTISNALTIGFAFMVIFNVLHIFTSDWAGTIEAFKGLGPIVMLTAGILFAISSLGAIMLKSKKEGSKR
jgi:hypothetical protein